MVNPPANEKAIASESRSDSPKLTVTPPATSPVVQTIDLRIENEEREMLYVREAVNQMLRNQIYGPSRDGRDSTLIAFASPTTGVQFQPTAHASSSGQQREAILPCPTPVTQMRPQEPRFPHVPPYDQQRFQQPMFEQLNTTQLQRLDVPRPLEFPYYERETPDDWLFRVEQIILSTPHSRGRKDRKGHSFSNWDICNMVEIL